MPKVINNEKITKIIKLKDEKGFSFSQIAEKLSIHQNTVSRLYHEHKDQHKALVPVEVLPADDASAIKVIVSERRRKTNEIREDIDTAVEEIGSLLGDETYSLYTEDALEQIGVYPERAISLFQEFAVKQFKKKYGLDRFTDQQLYWLSDAWGSFWNQTKCTGLSEADSLQILAGAFIEGVPLAQKNLQLLGEKKRLEQEIEYLRQQRMAAHKNMQKIQLQVMEMRMWASLQTSKMLS